MRQSTGSTNAQRVAVALGAGGIRGWAHVGALKALHQANVPIDLIVGASAGALIGPLYAARRDPQEMESIATAFSVPDFAEWFLRGLKLSPEGGDLAARLWEACGRLSFDEMAVHFAAVAHDIATGERLVLNEGLVAPAVEASIRPPFFGTPTHLNGHHLLDGGFQTSVPVDLAREMGAALVIAVNVGAFVRLPRSLRPHSAALSQRLGHGHHRPESLRGQLAFTLRMLARDRVAAASPDIEIRPWLSGVSAFAPWHLDLAIARGEQAARAALPAIHAALRPAPSMP